ncbi:MAG: hypothetical protein IJV82_06130 [Oscillospiraceae bacterium]|nr:hypothetical protein [Oscillospiraceae bacterium]
MKKIATLLLAALLLTGCANRQPEATTAATGQPTGAPTAPSTQPPTDPTPESTTAPTIGATTPTQRPTKTIYVRSAETSASGSGLVRTDYFFDERDFLSQVLIYTNGNLTQQYSVDCDAYGNYIRWTSDDSRIEYFYDGFGNPLGQTSYVGDTLISETVYTWDGRLRTGVTTRIPAQGLEHRSVLTYNESGALIRTDNYSGSALASYCLYTLGEDGRPVSMATYRTDGTLEQSLIYTYEGEITIAAAYTPEGILLQSTEQIFDDQGNLTSTTSYDAEGKMLTQQTHTWKAIQVSEDSIRASI